MFKRIKAWIHRLIVADIEESLDELFPVYLKTIADSVKTEYDRERLVLDTHASAVKAETEQTLAELKAAQVQALDTLLDKTIAARLEDFRAQMQSTAEAVKRTAAPTTWTANTDAVKADHILRNAAPLKKRK